jgi:predicted lipid-binding transport protein (Tim44 family)
MGVAVARALLGGLGVLLILGGIMMAAVGGPAGGLSAALTFFIPGIILVAAVVLERTRYRSLHAERQGDAAGPGGGEPRAPEPRFQPTGERFLDPTTHVAMRVWVDPATGERRYVPEG